jgi:hypothetical protein
MSSSWLSLIFSSKTAKTKAFSKGIDATKQYTPVVRTVEPGSVFGKVKETVHKVYNAADNLNEFIMKGA